MEIFQPTLVQLTFEAHMDETKTPKTPKKQHGHISSADRMWRTLPAGQELEKPVLTFRLSTSSKGNDSNWYYFQTSTSRESRSARVSACKLNTRLVLWEVAGNCTNAGHIPFFIYNKMKYTLGTLAVHLISVYLTKLVQKNINLVVSGRRVNKPSPELETDTVPYFPSGPQWPEHTQQTWRGRGGIHTFKKVSPGKNKELTKEEKDVFKDTHKQTMGIYSQIPM